MKYTTLFTFSFLLITSFAEPYDLVIYGSSPAAVQAIDADGAVQDLPYGPLAAKLKADGQVIDICKKENRKWN